MFHLHSLKDPPPKRMCETINFTSEVEATISSQESQPPPIQRQVDQSTASEDNGTIPTCGFQLSKKALCPTPESRISIQVVFRISLATL